MREIPAGRATDVASNEDFDSTLAQTADHAVAELY